MEAIDVYEEKEFSPATSDSVLMTRSWEDAESAGCGLSGMCGWLILKRKSGSSIDDLDLSAGVSQVSSGMTTPMRSRATTRSL
jgi:hypothetical protein